jgi:FdhD protein
VRSESHYAYQYGSGDAPPSRRRVLVPAEEALYVRLNGKPSVAVMRQPGDDLELAVGHCWAEGLVPGPEAILSARHCLDDANTVDVFITGEPPEAASLVDTACTGRSIYAGRLPQPLTGEKTPLLSAAELIGMATGLREQQEQYRAAGGVHAAALFDARGRLVVAREDVGRNNAVDKVAGYCALRQMSAANLVLVVTGRASSGMVLKAARIGVPVLASLSNTTSLGLSLARRLRLTLAIYLRGQKFQVCAHRERIGAREQGGSSRP